MRIYRPKFKKTQRNGTEKRANYSRWYVDFTDHTGQRRRIAAFESKEVSEDFANHLQTLINRHQSGTAIEDSPELIEWMRKLPDDIIKRLIQWGLVPRHRGEALKPLAEHIADFADYLKSKGRSADYVQRMKARPTVVCDGCGFTTFRDIHPSRVEKFLDCLKDRQYSATSRNHYADAIKTFLNWCCSREGGNRFTGNPLSGIKNEKRNSERKGVLSPEQFLTLIHTAIAKNTVIGGTTGRERGVLYLLAGSTGLRRKELLLLKWNDLHLDEVPPYVLARADTTKNAKEARLPLPASVCDVLKQVKEHRDGDYVFTFGGGKWPGNLADWMRSDLAAAELPLFDREGNEIFFHSLRNSFISFLANSNTPMKVVQKLARHSDPKLTYNTYARTFAESEQEAIQMLPNWSVFCAAASVAKIPELVETNRNKSGNVMATQTQKTAFLLSERIPPRGLEPLLPG